MPPAIHPLIRPSPLLINAYHYPNRAISLPVLPSVWQTSSLHLPFIQIAFHFLFPLSFPISTFLSTLSSLRRLITVEISPLKRFNINQMLNLNAFKTSSLEHVSKALTHEDADNHTNIHTDTSRTQENTAKRSR